MVNFVGRLFLDDYGIITSKSGKGKKSFYDKPLKLFYNSFDIALGKENQKISLGTKNREENTRRQQTAKTKNTRWEQTAKRENTRLEQTTKRKT